MSEAEIEWRKNNPGVSPLVHHSRVCGYYSRIESWNKSKLGELQDRHKGTYVLEEANES